MTRRWKTYDDVYDGEKEVEYAERQRAAELKMARLGHYAPGMSFAESNALDNAVKRENLPAERYSDLEWKYRVLGGAMSPGERQRTQELMAAYNRPTERQRFVADNEYRNKELQTRETEARYKKEGMIGQGATAAEHNAKAVKHKADRDMELGKYKADRDAEIAGQNASNERVAGINADAQVDVQAEKNKGTATAGEWAVRTEQQRAKTEAAKAAAQERVYQNRYGERSATTDNAKIAAIVAQLQKNPKFRKLSEAELRRMAENRYYGREQGGGE